MEKNTENTGIQNMNAEEKNARDMFNTLYSINLQGSTETRDGLTYLTWSKAWKLFKQFFPTATYKIIRDQETQLPYYSDGRTGIMVHTQITANNQTHEMMLPVMDSKNKAMRFEPYTYQVLDRSTGSYIEKTVQEATMFEINKALLRCFVKNLAMFGLGLYLYEGEDYPQSITIESSDETETNTVVKQQQQQAPTPPEAKKMVGRNANSDRYSKIREALNGAKTTEMLWRIYFEHKAEVDSNKQIRDLFTERKNQLKAV